MATETRYCNRGALVWITAHSLERAVAFSDQDTHRVVAGIGYREIRNAVSVEVPYRHGGSPEPVA